MDVMVMQKCSSFKMLSLFLDMQNGKHVSSPLLKYLKVQYSAVTSSPHTVQYGTSVCVSLIMKVRYLRIALPQLLPQVSSHSATGEGGSME